MVKSLLIYKEYLYNINNKWQEKDHPMTTLPVYLYQICDKFFSYLVRKGQVFQLLLMVGKKRKNSGQFPNILQ